MWHTELFYKLKKQLPHNFYHILESYLTDRYFLISYQEELQPIKSGVLQRSVLDPLLYLLFTSDLISTQQTIIGTFADDTTVLATHKDPKVASRNLQENIKKIHEQFKTWRIKANEQKSVHVTFTLNKKTCPSMKLNNKEIPQADTAKYLGIHLDRGLT